MRISDWSSDVCSSDLRLPSMSTSEPQRRPAIRAVSFDDVGEAIGRLLAIARSDTGQAARVADFLLAWWVGGTNGPFPLLTLHHCDPHNAEALVPIQAFLTTHTAVRPENPRVGKGGV